MIINALVGVKGVKAAASATKASRATLFTRKLIQQAKEEAWKLAKDFGEWLFEHLVVKVGLQEWALDMKYNLITQLINIEATNMMLSSAGVFDF